MARPVSLFDDTGDDEDEVSVSQAKPASKVKPMSLFEEEGEEDDESPISTLPDNSNKEAQKSFGKTALSSNHHSLFDDDDDEDEDENAANQTSHESGKSLIQPNPVPSLFDEAQVSSDTQEKKKSQTNLPPSLFDEEEHTPAPAPTSSFKRGMGMGFLFKGSTKENGKNKKPPKSLFDDNDEDEEDINKTTSDISTLSKEAKKIEQRNIYDDGPSSLFDNDDQNQEQEQEQGEEDDEDDGDSDSHDEDDDDAAIALKISKLMKPLSQIPSMLGDMPQPTQEKKIGTSNISHFSEENKKVWGIDSGGSVSDNDNYDEEQHVQKKVIDSEDIDDAAALKLQLRKEKEKVAKLEKMLRQADKKIVYLEKEVRSLKRGETQPSSITDPGAIQEASSEERDMARRRRLAKMQQQQRKRRGSTTQLRSHKVGNDKKVGAEVKANGSSVVEVAVDDTVLPEVKEDGRNSLSSFEDSDLEKDESGQQQQPHEQQQQLQQKIEDKAFLNTQLDGENDEQAQLYMLDNEVDEYVCYWASGKSIVDMLITLPEMWPSATPKTSDLEQCEVSSSIIRREYLKCVRKVHPDKQKHAVIGDKEGKRQQLLAQKLFAALTDSYHMWTENNV